MVNQDKIFELSEIDERIVRTYECTKVRRFLAPANTGFLTITNKRVIFHSAGKSLLGKSLLINEMPIEDTAGVRAYLEVTINWLYFALLCAAVFGVLWYLSRAAPFLTSWWLAILLMLPFAAIWLATSGILSEQTMVQLFARIDERAEHKVQSRELMLILRPVTRVPFILGCALLAWSIASSETLTSVAPFNYVILIGVYFAIYVYLIGQQRTFSLRIGSRTMKGSGIYIPGTSLLTILTRDTTAPDTLGAAPAEDAEAVTRELGALLLDIRQLGDQGIQKWSNPIIK